MGKSRTSRSRSGGTEPQIGDMEIPQDRDTITELPQEDPGVSTQMQQDEDAVDGELADLIYNIYEEEALRGALHKDVYDRQDKINELQKDLDYAVANNQNPLIINDIRNKIRKQEQELGHAQMLYEQQRDKVDEMNRRINQLETGFDVNRPVSWLHDNEDDDNGL